MPLEHGQSILDGLRWIRVNKDPSLAIRFSCIFDFFIEGAAGQAARDVRRILDADMRCEYLLAQLIEQEGGFSVKIAASNGADEVTQEA